MKIKHDPSQVTPQHIGLIVVLACVLVYMIWPGSSSSDAPPSNGPIRLVTPETQPAKTQASATLTDTNTVERFFRFQDRWKRPSSFKTSLFRNDPFQSLVRQKNDTANLAAAASTNPPVVDPNAARLAAAEAAAKLAAEKERRTLEAEAELKDRIAALNLNSVNAIFQTEKGTSALVGDKVIYEGQLLDGVLRVVSIRPSGITVRVESAAKSVTGNH